MGCTASTASKIGAPTAPAPTLLSSRPHSESDAEIVQSKASNANELTSAPNDLCVQQVIEASILENEAIELDRSGSTVEAIAMYRECEKLLDCGIQAATSAGHINDRPKLVQHMRQVHERIEHLTSLGGHAATIPVEQHIKPAELSMKHTTSEPNSSTADDGCDVKTLAVYATVGAGAGFLVLGSTLAVVGGAAGGAYLATRQGNAGDTVRAVGDLAAAGADKARELNRKHEVAEKIAEAGNKACAVAKSTEEKYCLSDKVTKGIDTVVQKGKEIDEKHSISEKVARGVDAVVQKGKEVDEKHSLSDTIVKGVDVAVQKGKAIDERHGVGDKLTQGVNTMLQKGKDIDDTHQVTDKVSSGLAMGMDRISGWFGRRDQSVTLPTSGAAGQV